MENRQYAQTLYLPGIHGQWKLWKSFLAERCNDADYVVSFGDLIGCTEEAADSPGRGPNQAVLAYTRMYSTYSENWTQLIGPNEIAALNSPDTWTNQDSTAYLRDAWLDSGTFQAAAAQNGRLLTHAGLTYGEWVAIDRPATAEEAAARLNEKYNGTLNQGPAYRLTGRPNYAANPLWADPVLETYPSWTTTVDVCPFDQIHAESSVNTELGRRLLKDQFSPLSSVSKSVFKAYGSLVRVGEAQFTAVDFRVRGEILTQLPTSTRLLITQTRKA